MGLMLPDGAIIEDIDTGMISFEELSSGIESIEENITGNGER